MARLLLLCLAGSMAIACNRTSSENGGVSVIQPWVRATPNPRMAAAYFTLRNGGHEKLKLLSVSGTVAERVELHESVEQEGVVRMVAHPEGFDIPAGGDLKLERGGKHVMLIGLNSPLSAGNTVKLRLALSNDASLTIEAPVRDATTEGS